MYSSRVRDDEYMSPMCVFKDILDLIPRKIIWEPFPGDGTSTRHLRDLGFEVVHGDFYSEDHGDVVVTNPPFSQKKQVLTRLKELNKPFILLLPSWTLHTQYMRNLFYREIKIAIPRKRIEFLKEGVVQGRCNFECFYYLWKIPVEREITWL